MDRVYSASRWMLSEVKAGKSATFLAARRDRAPDIDLENTARDVSVRCFFLDMSVWLEKGEAHMQSI